MFFADGESDTKKTLGFGSKMTAGGILGHDGAKVSASKLSKSFGTKACKVILGADGTFSKGLRFALFLVEG